MITHFKIWAGRKSSRRIVNTTAEVCLLIFDDIKFERKFDETTGYNELVVHEK